MDEKREFPGRLSHRVPGWVKAGAVFHIRIRADRAQFPALTEPALARDLIGAIQRYHDTERWWCRLAVLMPDHLHALLVLPETDGMAKTVRDWKRGTARFQGVRWQDNFFDHRLRSEQEADEAWRISGKIRWSRGWSPARRTGRGDGARGSE